MKIYLKWILMSLAIMAVSAGGGLDRESKPTASSVVYEGDTKEHRALPDQFVQLEVGRFRMGSRLEEGAKPREVEVSAFAISKYETSVSEYVAFLNATGKEGTPETDQYVREGSRLVAHDGQGNMPVVQVSCADALEFCRWVSIKWSCNVRLPTEVEWEYAARGGIEAAPYPWGWGTPVGRANFDTDGVIEVDELPPNAYGLFNMAGNVFEWCQPQNEYNQEAVVCGGSWSERSETMLHVAHHVPLPLTYSDTDVGFRVVISDIP